MRTRMALPCALTAFAVQIALTLSVAGSAAAATTYRVGPGHPYATPSDVPWESLVAGDSVLIHARPQPYRDKWVICRTGTQAQPIVVRGIADPGRGALPLIEGANAVTRPQLNFWSEGRGVIKIGGANSPPDLMPAWIVIENLDIKGARPENTFTGRDGLTSYGGNAAAIYVEKGQNIVVRGCHFHDCSNGFFCASETSNLLVESNWIEDNGNVGSIFEHNNYTEALGITFQFNRFGPLRAGAGGNNLKDRSAGCVIRYNWIEGGNRQLDLVETDFAALANDPRYHTTFVYGNVLYERADDGNSQIVHYGGDGGGSAMYRKGTLYFHHNTVISKRSGNTTLLRLSTNDESADVRDNVLYVTATGNRLAMLDSNGSLDLTRNWIKTGWVASHSGGNPDVANLGQVLGSAPGFVDFAAENFELADGSACLDTSVALASAAVPDHVPVREYVKHQTWRPRPDDGTRDLGAYEHASFVAVPGAPGEPAGGAFRLQITPQPVAGRANIALVGLGGATVDPAPAHETLEIYNLTGRRVALLHTSTPGRWAWSPERGLSPGVYLLRAGNARGRLTLVGP